VAEVIAAAGRDLAFAGMSALAPPGVDVRRAGDDLAGVAFLVPGQGPVPDLSALEDLRVVQVLSAGTEWIEPHVPAWATLCNARGARDLPVAEWVVGALLGAATGLLRSARERVWEEAVPDELAGSNVLVVGHGSIGEAVRARLEPLGVTVIGVARAAREGVQAVEDLPALLPWADAVVVLTPLTEATRGLVDAAFLSRMRDGALLLNAGRGAVVDTDALLAELRAGRLRAVLDVTDPEPLPEGHPLWDAPGVLAITPHHAGDSRGGERRAARLAAEQLVRYARGEPLVNVVLAAGR
jgi:phosphoglycerate dehydrogenase-like enzyme